MLQNLETIKNDLIIDKNYLNSLTGTSLFYPCSGEDILYPIQYFSDYISDFYYIDNQYFTQRDEITKTKFLVEKDQNFKFIRKLKTDIKFISGYYNRNNPIVESEEYLNKNTDRIFRIHRINFDAKKFFDYYMNDEKIGIFFYRGDSQGEGGSGFCWLNESKICNIIQKLVEDGLFIIDGSDGYPYMRSGGIYSQFCKYTWKDLEIHPLEAIRSMKKIKLAKRNLKCVGYAGFRYGHTLIWHIKKRIPNF